MLNFFNHLEVEIRISENLTNELSHLMRIRSFIYCANIRKFKCFFL